MVVEKVEGRLVKTQKRIDTVCLEWFERDKKRMRKQSKDGEEIGICVDTVLQEGDILAENEERIIVVTFAPCELIRIPVSSMQEMGRLCFELGNRHMSLAVKEDNVTIPYDALIYSQLEHLGFQPEKILECFTDYIVCRAHGAGQEHTNDRKAPHEHQVSLPHSHVNQVSHQHAHVNQVSHQHSHEKQARCNNIHVHPHGHDKLL